MKKYQNKERSLLLLSYAMLQEGFKIVGIDPMKVKLEDFDDELDIKLLRTYRSLHRLNKMFSNKKIQKFLMEKIAKSGDKLSRECQPMYVGLLVLYFYLKVDRDKSEFYISTIEPEDIIKIAGEVNGGISDCTIYKSCELFRSIYGDKGGFLEFLELMNRFPYNLKEK